MNTRDSLRKAAQELFGKDALKRDRNDPQEQAPTTDAGAPINSSEPAPESPENVYTPNAVQAAPQQVPSQATVAPGADSAQLGGGVPPVQPTQNIVNNVAIVDPMKETSIIARGTTVIGRIRTDGHMKVLGRVEGNIEADGNVTVMGRVSGNIKGVNLELMSCQVKGNLSASATVSVNSETVIIGDITSDNLIFDGKLKGNVVTTQAAIFSGQAYLLGDITTNTISIASGAVINGMITTKNNFDEDDDVFDSFF